MTKPKRKKTIREIGVSEFRTKCFSFVTQVEKTKVPIRLTKRGKAIADVIPIAAPVKEDRRDWLGSMAGTIKITGDIVSPVIDLNDFDVFSD
jgi:prevent-host-death family protein